VKSFGRAFGLVALALTASADDLEEGVRLFEAGRFTEAIERLERARAQQPGSARAHLFLGLALQDLHRTDEAIAALERARALDAEGPATANALARAYLAADRLHEAETTALAGLERHPRDPDLLYARALALVRSGKAPAARAPLESMLAIAPRHPDAAGAHFMLASILERAGETASARAQRERGERVRLWHRYREQREARLRENPRDPLAWLGMGLLWMEVGEFAKAEEAFGRSAACDPAFARARFHLGEARRARGDLSSAAAAYAEAARLDPKYVRAHYHLGLALEALGRTPEAEDAFEEVVRLDPEANQDKAFLEARKHLGWLREAAGDAPRARTHYEAYLRLGGADPVVPERLRRLGG
jgi:tetratricopeptide (TPR) repeat protein